GELLASTTFFKLVPISANVANGMRDIEGPGRTGISCRGDSPLFSLQLCKLGWFNQLSLTARLKLKVVQEQLLSVNCRITVDGDTVVVPAGAATSITLLDIKPSREALSEAKIIQRADDRLCIRRPPNATYRRHGSCCTRYWSAPHSGHPSYSFHSERRKGSGTPGFTSLRTGTVPPAPP